MSGLGQSLALIISVCTLIGMVATVAIFFFRSGRQLEIRDRRLIESFEAKLTALRTELEGKHGGVTSDTIDAVEARISERVREVMQQKHEATMDAQRAAMSMQRSEQAHAMDIVHERLTKMAHADKNRAAENAALAARLDSLPTQEQFGRITARLEGVAASQRETKVMLEQISESLHREREAVLLEKRKGS